MGHGRTFWVAQERARAQGGALILRNEDLDRARCQAGFSAAMLEDLRWLGLHWDEGPDVSGRFGPYTQSERMGLYRKAFQELRSGGFIYPCSCSRQDVLRALQAPHAGEDEPVYPGTCRPSAGLTKAPVGFAAPGAAAARLPNWRFRVSDGESVSFIDGYYGPQQFLAGEDFGDFIVWRQDDLPAYQLAVVVDDAAMQITEVVRGEDLLKSTARQLLLYRALKLQAPGFYHCPLLQDEDGVRLAKRHDALSLRALRAAGAKPEELRAPWLLHKGIKGG